MTLIEFVSWFRYCPLLCGYHSYVFPHDIQHAAGNKTELHGERIKKGICLFHSSAVCRITDTFIFN